MSLATSHADPQPLDQTRQLTQISLYAALIGVGAFIHIPFGPMHISLQTMMVNLAGFALGPKKAALTLLLYNLCGFIGLPMFGRGKAGPASFLGPTAGYFAGFVLSAVISGLALHFGKTRKSRFIAMLAFGAVGALVDLMAGTLVLHARFIHDWRRAFLVGFAPFIITDLAKMVVAALIADRFLHRSPRNA